MPEKDRQLKIITKVRENIGVSVSELAEKMDVTPNTIRRDLEKLEKEGIIKKIHGAAVLDDLSYYDRPFKKREIEHKEEKNKIGKKAASLVNKGDTIIIDAGTTCLAVASYLKSKNDITVLSNSVAAITELDQNKEITVILSGGVLKGMTRSLIGPPAEKFFKLVEVDKLFLSAGAISLKKQDISNPNIPENPVKQKMIASAREVILVVDSYKIKAASFYPFASFEDIDKIIIDDNLDDENMRLMDNLELEVVYV